MYLNSGANGGFGDEDDPEDDQLVGPEVIGQ